MHTSPIWDPLRLLYKTLVKHGGLPGVDADDSGNRDNGISGATERYL